MRPHRLQRLTPCFLSLLFLLSFGMLVSAGCTKEDRRGIAPKGNKKKTDSPARLYNESHALVIGVSEYTGGWPQLPGVKADVQTITQALQKHGFHVVVVENPTSAELDKAYRDFIVQYGLRADNRLLLYFAGHGYTHKPSYATNDPKEWMGYIVARDAPRPGEDIGPFLLHAIRLRTSGTFGENRYEQVDSGGVRPTAASIPRTSNYCFPHCAARNSSFASIRRATS
jgi:hypothetical protein